MTLRALKTFFLAFLLVCVFPLAVQAAAEILSHKITARIDPSRHLLEATDQILVGQSPKKGKPFSFLLAPALKLMAITLEPEGRSLSWRSESTLEGQILTPVLAASRKFPVTLKVRYQGEIHDPVRRSGSLSYLRGDATRGIIGPEGIYLSPESGWYPDQPGSLARFDLEVEVPVPLRAVSQGKLVKEEERGDVSRSIWRGEVPAEGLYLLAGNYMVSSRRHPGPGYPGVELFTYFFAPESAQAPRFLAAAEEIIGFYSKLLGPYPYSRFAIVENFFSSGYGMPGFTVLGPQVIQMGERALQPGYLDHEIVHSWWGNYVYPVVAKGNWSEGLTSYLTNYLAKEVREGKERAIAHRKGNVQKFSTRVSPQEEYAPEDFRDKRREADDDIGYGKISMIFHLLRREVGDELFYKSLRTIVQTYGGRRASWEDFEKVFSQVTKRNLRGFFRQWLTVPASPSLSLEEVQIVPRGKNFWVRGVVRQEEPVFGLKVPVVVDLGGEKKTFVIPTWQRTTRFTTEVDRLPRRVVLDPEFHVFRRLSDREVPPSLQAFLSSPARLIVLPGAAPARQLEVYRQLADRIATQKGARILADSAVTDDLLRENSLFFLGAPAENRALEKVLERGNVPIRWAGEKIKVKGEEFDFAQASLLASWRNPVSPSRFVTLYAGGSEKALERWPYVFFYGWDGYLVFSAGKPARRGDLVETPTRAEFSFARMWSEKIRPESLESHAKFLAAAEMKGRLTGSPEGLKAAEYIEAQWKKQKLAPAGNARQGAYFQPFPIRLRDLARFRLVLRAEGKTLDYSGNALPLAVSPSGVVSFPLVRLPGADAVVEGVQGKGIIMPVPLSRGNADLNALSAAIGRLQEAGATAVLLETREKGRAGPLEPFLLYPSRVTPNVGEKIRRAKEEGSMGSRDAFLGRLAPWEGVPGSSWRIPVLWLEGDLPGDLEGAVADLEISYRDVSVGGQNVVALIEGNDPRRRGELVILGAHYDHLGVSDDGKVFPGADDNASGVAAVLEIGRVLSENRGLLRRSVALVAFDGEEWGLRGSRFLAASDIFRGKKPIAMLNLDTIGGKVPGDEVFLVGAGMVPALAGRVRAHLKDLNLAAGRDIDRFAFVRGSDHYPFHLLGVPALSFFSSNYRQIHRPTDTADRLDVDKMRRVAGAALATALDLLTGPEDPPVRSNERR